MTELVIKTPRVFLPALQPCRYLGIHGGRGSGKSHFVAEKIIEAHVMGKRDTVCLRETQKSLQHSSKKLLEYKIEAMGVGSYFEIQSTRILSKHGGVIIFEGLANHTADSIKSLEGFDEAWVEEAQSLSQRSLDILRPTIRKKDSTIIFTWNPRALNDPVDALLRHDKVPPDSVVIEANYLDNPFLPKVLQDEMEYDRARDLDKYAHVWLGKYLQNSAAQVFKNWKIEECEPPRGATLHYGADFGFSIDPSCLVRCWIDGRTLYVDYEAWQIGCEIDKLPELFMSVPDAERWPIVADTARPETISYLRNHGFPKILAAVKGARSVEEGVEFLKSHDIVVHPRCKHLIDELTMYSYKTDALTGKVLPILQDKNNHCIAEGVLITCERGDVPIEDVTLEDKVLTRGGYRRVLFSDVTDVNRKILKVETTGGTVYCTPDHKIFTSKGFTRADALGYNDEVINLKETLCQNASSTTERSGADIPTVLNEVTECITRGAMYTYTAKSGLTTTEGFRKDITYTIRTAIQTIMTFPTWNAYQLKSTVPNTQPTTLGCTSILRVSDRLQKNGMPAKQVVSSMLKLGRKLTSILSQWLSRAGNAVKNSCLKSSEARIDSAQTIANPSGAENPAWMMNNVNAHNAAKPLLQINTPRHELVAGRVLTVTEHGISERVYDLTVEEHHEFFANGVLVLNCLDALRYSCEGTRRAKTNKPVSFQPLPSANSW